MPAPSTPLATEAPRTLQDVAADEAVRGTEHRLRRALKPFLGERSARKKLARAIMAEMQLEQPWSQRTWRKQAARHGLLAQIDLAENAAKNVWLQSLASYQKSHPTPYPPEDRPPPWPLTQSISPPETAYHGADVVYAYGSYYLRVKE